MVIRRMEQIVAVVRPPAIDVSAGRQSLEYEKGYPATGELTRRGQDLPRAVAVGRLRSEEITVHPTMAARCAARRFLATCWKKTPRAYLFIRGRAYCRSAAPIAAL